MNKQQISIVATSFSKACLRFSQWRNCHRPRTRLPEKLWSMAVELAREHGVNRTAKTLHLDYYSLKKRLDATPDSGRAANEFIEIYPVGISSPGNECKIEIEDGGGARMQIHFKGAEIPDLAAITRAFRRDEA